MILYGMRPIILSYTSPILSRGCARPAIGAGEKPLSFTSFRDLLLETIDRLDVSQARKDVAPFVKDQEQLALWSHDFFRDVASRIQCNE